MPSIQNHIPFSFVLASTDSAFGAAKNLFLEYAAALGIDLCFQNFNRELEEITIQYNQPVGGLILLTTGPEYIGCVGIRRLENQVAELKRMYIKPQFRKLGLGKILLDRAMDLAKDLGYHKIRLDTLVSLTAAVHLYEKAGFKRIEAYYTNPGQEVLYYEKDI